MAEYSTGCKCAGWDGVQRPGDLNTRLCLSLSLALEVCVVIFLGAGLDRVSARETVMIRVQK